MTSQVHASDERSILENLAPQAEVVSAARRKFRGLPVHVTPVNLRPRFNAARRRRGAPNVSLPADARLHSPFGAAWLLGSAKYLADGGAASVTFGDLLSPGAPQPGWSAACAVLQTLAEYSGQDVLRCRASRPLTTVGLHARGAAGRALLLGNLTPAPLTVFVRGLPAGDYAAAALDATAAGSAGDSALLRGTDGGFEWELPAHGRAAFRPA